MRTVITTVKEASVKINDKIVGQITKGMLILVGFTSGDDKDIVDRMVDKIVNLRIFPDENNKINLSLADINGRILSVSQFTLYADVKKSRRPSFVEALAPHDAEILYDYFNNQLENKVGPISTGIFGADMDVTSINEGPFTLILESKDLFN